MVVQKRILLVEDHEPNIKISGALLNELGYDYDVACGGPDALKKLSFPHPYALVIMDVQMPGMDGLEATRQLRAAELKNGIPTVPVIGMTGNATKDDEFFCFKAGMDDFISKPFRLSELETKLKKLSSR